MKSDSPELDLLDKIPQALSKVVELVDREIDKLHEQDELSEEDRKALLNYCSALTGIYKEHQFVLTSIERQIKGLSKQQLLEVAEKEGKRSKRDAA